MQSKYVVYILECRDGSFYTGITIDMQKRFTKHAAGLGGAYTRSHPPVKILYQEKVVDRSQALKREAELKKLSKAQKEKLIAIIR